MRRGTVQASRPGDRDQREARVSAVFLSDPSGGETQPRSRAALRTHPSVRPWAEPSFLSTNTLPRLTQRTHTHHTRGARTHAHTHTHTHTRTHAQAHTCAQQPLLLPRYKHKKYYTHKFITLKCYMQQPLSIFKHNAFLTQLYWYAKYYDNTMLFLYIGPSFDVNTMVWLWLFCNYSVCQIIMIFSSYSCSFATVLCQWMKLFKSIAI